MAGERSDALLPPIIQVGRPFAEHRRTLPGALIVGTGPAHFVDWKFAAQCQSRAIAPSTSSLPRLAQQGRSLPQRYAKGRDYLVALSMRSLPMPMHHHVAQQGNEHVPQHGFRACMPTAE